MSTLPETIRARRKELGLTLDDVAAVVGVTPGALSHVESGRRLPDARNAIAIALALQLDPDLLLTLLDEAHADRRASQVGWTMPAERNAGRARRSGPAPNAVFSEMPIDALFAPRMSMAHEMNLEDAAPATRSEPDVRMFDARQVAAEMHSSRDRARYSRASAERLHAAEELAEDALRAIRTLRGMLDDDDPTIAREARRLLRELDVRGPEE